MRVITLFILFAIIACTVEAQALEPEGPQNVSVTTGLDRPQDTRDPGPWLRVEWDKPDADLIEWIVVEVFDGQGRPIHDLPEAIHTEHVWISTNPDQGPRKNTLKYLYTKAGCEFSPSHMLITSDCVERHNLRESNTWKGGYPFQPNFLSTGQTYKIRVFFVTHHDPTTGTLWHGGEQTFRVNMPIPASPTSTPRPNTKYLGSATPIPFNQHTRHLEQRVRELERELAELRTEFDQLLAWAWMMYDWKITVDDKLRVLEK